MYVCICICIYRTHDKIIKWNNILVIQHWVFFMVLMSWFSIISLIKLYRNVETCMFACGELDVGTPVCRDTRQRSAPPSVVSPAHLLQGLCPLGSPVWSTDLHLETRLERKPSASSAALQSGLHGVGAQFEPHTPRQIIHRTFVHRADSEDQASVLHTFCAFNFCCSLCSALAWTIW